MSALINTASEKVIILTFVKYTLSSINHNPIKLLLVPIKLNDNI